MHESFELVKARFIPELNTQAHLYRHKKTGAQLLSMENDDENKVFGITFFTPPADSTGLPHIMEHSVLCGSRKYPLKEPFVELLKSSLNTFLNAMTFSDKTCYPVASQNLKDFYNLIDVYLDAVFYPRLTPEILKQEGWHYELESVDGPMVYKGVVFNEMKGAYSSPDVLLGRYSEKSLFPEGTYSVDSGGDPKVIPDLTYEQFRAFYERYYHPSNALIYFYGDDDPAERLRLIDAYLRDFEALPPTARVQTQPPFDKPRQLTFGYDASDDAASPDGQDGQQGRKGMVTVNWVLTETTNLEDHLALEILAYILIGTPASPLRKALIDSGLGENLAGGGVDDQLYQMYFSTGLKGIAVEDSDKVEALILETLRKLAEEGIDPETVEAALNTIEFRLREQNTGRYPRGLFVMLGALSTWVYGGDPLAMLAFEAPLNAIKARVAAGERYFEGLIRQYLLDNTHRATVTLKPDPTLREREEAAEKARLAKARQALGQDDLARLVEETEQLRQMQAAPDPPEALAALPSLTLADLDRETKIVPLEAKTLHGSTILYHDLFTNGIVYLDLGLNLHLLPQAYLPYVELFSRALLETGTEREDFVRLSQRIGRKTGGIRTATFSSAVKASDQAAAWLFLRGKSTVPQADDLLDILRDVLLTARLDNRERLRQIVLEEKVNCESGLVPGGHQVVNTRLRAHFNEADWAEEQIGGLNYLFFLRDLAARIDSDWPAVLEALEALRQTLLNRNALLCNITLDANNWARLEPKLSGFLDSLPAGAAALPAWAPSPLPPNEGLTIPAQVNYVGKGADLFRLGYRSHGSEVAITNYLRTTWLWERVRVQGGAYGGYCFFDRHSGVFTYLSYRDPNLLSTLENYDSAAAFLRGLDLSEQELTRSIIGGIGIIDAYQLPDAKGYASMLRYLVGETDEARQQYREELLSATAADFRRFGEALARLGEEGLVTVLGSPQAIEAANAGRDGWLHVTRVL